MTFYEALFVEGNLNTPRQSQGVFQFSNSNKTELDVSKFNAGLNVENAILY